MLIVPALARHERRAAKRIAQRIVACLDARLELVADGGARRCRFRRRIFLVAWWDLRASWFVEELEILRRVAPIIACPESVPLDQVSQTGSARPTMYRQPAGKR
jgi:hypothetical protein